MQLRNTWQAVSGFLFKRASVYAEKRLKNTPSRLLVYLSLSFYLSSVALLTFVTENKVTVVPKTKSVARTIKQRQFSLVVVKRLGD